MQRPRLSCSAPGHSSWFVDRGPHVRRAPDMQDSTPDGNVLGDLALGALAGCIATVPMTCVMEALHRRLPQEERYPLPPRQIAMRVAEEVGVKEHPFEGERLGVTLLAHFGM